jgi:hypothetical protein
MRDYGNRVGVFRLMEVLDRYGVRATVVDSAKAPSFAKIYFWATVLNASPKLFSTAENALATA